MALTTLTIDIDARLANLERDLGKVAHLSEQAARRMDGAFNAVGLSIAGLASGLTVGGFAAFIKNSIDAADRLVDLSKVTNLLPSQLAGIGFAAEQSGTDLEGAAQAISKLSENMGKDADKFARIGVTAKDPIEAFKQLADVFNSIEDPQQRAALATEALGKSWREVAPLLAEGGKNIGVMVDKGTAMSGNIDELSKNSDIFKDKLAELQKQITASGGSIANELLPGMIATVDELNRMAESGNNFLPVGDAIRVIFETFVVLGANVGHTFKQIGRNIGGISAQLMALASGDFKGASNIGKMMKEDAERALKEIDAFSERVLHPSKPQPSGTSGGAPGIKKDTSGVPEFIRKPSGNDKKDPFKLENEAWVREKEFQIAQLNELVKAQEQADQEMKRSALEAQAVIFDIDPIAKAGARWEELTALVDKGLLTQEQAAQSYQKTFEDISKSGDDSFKRLEDAVRGWGSAFTDEMTKMVRTGKADFASLADSIINDLIRIQVQKRVTAPLVGDGTSANPGILTGFIDSMFGNAFSFDGGGFTGGGSRSGGIDGKGGFPAILHPNETVIDHARGQGGGSSTVIVNQTVNIDSRSDASVIMAAMAHAKDMAKAEILNSLSRGGDFARATGRA